MQLVAQQKPAGQAKQQGTQNGLHKLGNGLKGASAIRRQRLKAKKFPLLVLPALVHITQHAHGLDHFGIAQGPIGILLSGNGAAVGLHQRRFRGALIEPGHHHLDDTKYQRSPAQPWADRNSTIITSAMGVSMAARSAGEYRKSRMARKSLSGCCEAPGIRFRLASNIAPKMRPLMIRSSSTLAERITSLRAHSRTSITMYAPKISNVSITRVVWLRVFTTRSYTSSM